jgi:pantothenate synthetase
MYYGRTHKHDWDFKHIKEEVVERISAYKKFKVEYFEIVEAKTLKPAKGVKKDVQLRACIAVQTSTVRLIDNIIF